MIHVLKRRLFIMRRLLNQRSSSSGESIPWAKKKSQRFHVDIGAQLGADPALRKLTQSLISHLDHDHLHRCLHTLERMVMYWTNNQDQALKRFHELVGGQPELVANFTSFLQGSISSQSAATGIAPEVNSQAVSELTSLLLRIRGGSPHLLGAYTTVPPHLKLAPRAFGVFHELEALPPTFDDLLGGAGGGLGFGNKSQVRKAIKAAAGGDFVTSAEDVNRAAISLAEKLISVLPPATLARTAEALRRSESTSEPLSVDSSIIQRKIKLKSLSPRQIAFTNLVDSLGHHWLFVGPWLARFLRLYDAAAVEICPFRPAVAAYVASIEQQLAVPLRLMRGKVVTDFVKDASDAITVCPNESLSPSIEHLDGAMSNFQAIRAEVRKSGARILYDTKNNSTANLTRNLKLVFRVETEEQTICEIAEEVALRAKMKANDLVAPDSPLELKVGLWEASRTVVLRNLPSNVTASEIVETLRSCGHVTGLNVFNQAPDPKSVHDGIYQNAVLLSSQTDLPGTEAQARVKDDDEDVFMQGDIVEDDGEDDSGLIDDWADDSTSDLFTTSNSASTSETPHLEFVCTVERIVNEAQAVNSKPKEMAVLVSASSKAARERVTELSKLTKKHRGGRHAGVKSVVAARAIALRRDNDVYAFVEMETEQGAKCATIDAARIFGLQVGDSMCRTLPAVTAKTLTLHIVGGDAVSAEVEYWLNCHLAPNMFARTRFSTSLLTEVSPEAISLEFPSHEAAVWAFWRLHGKKIPRHAPFPDVTFDVQWLYVSDKTAKQAAQKRAGSEAALRLAQTSLLQVLASRAERRVFEK